MKSLATVENQYPLEVGQKVRYKGLLSSKLHEAYIVKIIDDDRAVICDRKGIKSRIRLERLLADASLIKGEAFKPLYMPWSKWLRQKERLVKLDQFLCEAIWTYVSHKVWPRRLEMPVISVMNLPHFIKGYWQPNKQKAGGGELLIDPAGRFGLNGLASVVAHETCHQYQTYMGQDAAHNDLFHTLAERVYRSTGIKVFSTADDASDSEFEMGVQPIESEYPVYYLFLTDGRSIEAGSALSKTTAANAFNAFKGNEQELAVYVMNDLALKKLCADLDAQRAAGRYTLTKAVDFMLEYVQQHGKVVLHHKPQLRVA